MYTTWDRAPSTPAPFLRSAEARHRSAGRVRDADRTSETRRLRPCQKEIDVGDAECAKVLPPTGRMCFLEHPEPPLLEAEPPLDPGSQAVGRLECLHPAKLRLHDRQHAVDGRDHVCRAQRRRVAGSRRASGRRRGRWLQPSPGTARGSVQRASSRSRRGPPRWRGRRRPPWTPRRAGCADLSTLAFVFILAESALRCLSSIDRASDSVHAGSLAGRDAPGLGTPVSAR